jgi:hypothetical protein
MVLSRFDRGTNTHAPNAGLTFMRQLELLISEVAQSASTFPEILGTGTYFSLFEWK